ncbi:MAG: histidine phosphatase family protein [Pseudomonadales bacterium]|nr:histidine phosphatase family protein [Pseudomonadales bacterium]NRA15663.1 histidine phosphatase family protein [Oceanospirillaceae bacterium]
MIHLYFIRHGQTQWNSEKKLQGRTNIPLNQQGREQISGYQLPAQLQQLQWFSSPLLRARETAELLCVNAATENQLIEMNWGSWEGKTLQQLRSVDPESFATLEAQGIDLCPPEGESPRLVGERISDWAEHLQALNDTQQLGCVSHKGVIRAIYALAANWDMQHKAPHKLDYHCAQHFCFDHGHWSIGELNIKLS